MTSYRKLKFAAAISLGLATTTVSVAETMEPEDAIVARRAVMRVNALNFDPLGAMTKGEIPFDAERFATLAERMVTVSSMPIADYFVDGTDVDIGDAKTRALPEIWLDWENFEKKLEAMRKEITALAASARSGDEEAMKRQVGRTAKSCKGCHDDFRS